MQNVLAIVIASGEVGRSEAEAVGAAQRLADELGGQAMVALLGPTAGAAAQEVLPCGVARIFAAAHPLLAEYSADLYLRAIEQTLGAAQPDVLVFPGNMVGLELAPRLAYRIDSAVVVDCTALRGLEDGAVQITKPVYGGKADTTLVAKEPPVTICLRSHSFDPFELVTEPSGQVRRLEIELDPAERRTQVVERLVEETDDARLEDARIIVSGGRGMGGPENFQLLKELADLLGGAIGASRAACDAGWAPMSWQIGQTGKKVAPDLYIAVGISGASQHLVGISGAENIVAINKDPQAPIFKAADVGIVEEYQKVLPTLLDVLRKRKSSGA